MLTIQEIKYMEKYRPIKLEYLAKCKEIENKYNNLGSYRMTRFERVQHPLYVMEKLLEELEEEYAPKIEAEEASLFSDKEMQHILTK